MKYPHVIRAVFDEPWAILPSKFQTIAELVTFRAEGGRLTPEEVQARIGAVDHPQARQSGSVGVLPLYGVVTQRAGMMQEFSGGTSTERFSQQFRQMVADPNCVGVVIDVDSPGGSVFGIDELAAEIYAARGSKPIVAVANSLAASAAYWIATAADELVVTPSGQVGSVGVVYQHTDYSAANDAAGVKVSYITSGRYKAEGNSDEPLSDEGRANLQDMCDAYYAAFVGAVARNRGVSADVVKSGYGEGRVVNAKQAVSAGMADRVATLDQTIARLMNPQSRVAVGRKNRTGAESETSQVQATVEATDTTESREDPKTEVSSDTDLRRRRLRLNSAV